MHVNCLSTVWSIYQVLSKHSLLNVYMSPSKQAALSERKDHVLLVLCVCVCVCVCARARVRVPALFFWSNI